MHQMKYVGVIALIIISFPLALGEEVERLDFGTDAFWKTINFEDSKWTAENYDDSWWEDAVLQPALILRWNYPHIWYPSEFAKGVAYFRKNINIPGNVIVNGEIKTATVGRGEIELYINNISVSRIKIYEQSSPFTVDITPFVKPGRNVIAMKVMQPESTIEYGLLLEGYVRYKT